MAGPICPGNPTLLAQTSGLQPALWDTRLRGPCEGLAAPPCGDAGYHAALGEPMEEYREGLHFSFIFSNKTPHFSMGE